MTPPSWGREDDANAMADVAHTIQVALMERTYSIQIGRELLSSLGEHLSLKSAPRRALVVSDENVAPLYADRVIQSLASAGIESDCAVVPPGETSKSLAEASKLYNRLAARNHERGEPIIALGGGMVGDLAGFVAATWMRGVPIIQCPTTLEADVDASVGGKTAINHPAGKNLIGAFHQPAWVVIDIDCLSTLPDRDITAGLAESVKHALLSGEAFFRWHETNAAAIADRDADTLTELVRRNCEIKAAVVSKDERETSSDSVGRAALNFGHTVGHAIEGLLNYDLRHGECVAIGMVAELHLAVQLGITPPTLFADCEKLLRTLNLPVRLPGECDIAALLGRMKCDKKSVEGRYRFTVPTDWGKVDWLDSSEDAPISAALSYLLSA